MQMPASVRRTELTYMGLGITGLQQSMITLSRQQHGYLNGRGLLDSTFNTPCFLAQHQ